MTNIPFPSNQILVGSEGFLLWVVTIPIDSVYSQNQQSINNHSSNNIHYITFLGGGSELGTSIHWIVNS